MSEGPSNISNKSHRCLNCVIGCVLFGCLFIFLGPFIYQPAADMYHNWKLGQHHRDWNHLKIEDYQITIHDVGLGSIGLKMPALGVIEVCNGGIINVNGQPCERSEYPNSCGADPVEALFHAARDKGRIFCWTKYDKQYDFPVDTGCFFIEGSWLEVTDFQVIDCSK